MKDPTTVLYALSTLAQTCAALAAFVGAVGLFRSQILREQRREEDQTRRLYVYARRGPGGEWTTPAGFGPLPGPADRVEQAIRDLERGHPDHPAASAHRRWEASARPLRDSWKALLVFEAWNLLVIGASLVGFNYIPLVVSAAWAYWALWAAALGTVGVTIGCVYAWTREGAGMPDSPKLTPETGKLELHGAPAGLIVTRAAETWQFFAFVFAAATTLALALLAEIPDGRWRMVTKVVAFLGLAYLTLINVRVRNWLAGLLNRFKEERR